jgi:hypothetical protein
MPFQNDIVLWFFFLEKRNEFRSTPKIDYDK